MTTQGVQENKNRSYRTTGTSSTSKITPNNKDL